MTPIEKLQSLTFTDLWEPCNKRWIDRHAHKCCPLTMFVIQEGLVTMDSDNPTIAAAVVSVFGTFGSGYIQAFDGHQPKVGRGKEYSDGFALGKEHLVKFFWRPV